jgi:acetolactate synthase small subunit
MSNTLELVVQELQNRIGQITTQYETQLAVLKVQANEALKQKDEEINQLKSVSVDAEPTKKEK